MLGNQKLEMPERKFVKHPESIQIIVEELAEQDDISPISHEKPVMASYLTIRVIFNKIKKSE